MLILFDESTQLYLLWVSVHQPMPSRGLSGSNGIYCLTIAFPLGLHIFATGIVYGTRSMCPPVFRSQSAADFLQENKQSHEILWRRPLWIAPGVLG